MKLIVVVENDNPTTASLSLSAISWQVSGLIRKITENKEQRKRPINQERIERGAINIKHQKETRLLLSLSLSAISWQVSGLIRKITENKEQRKRPINQERIERGAINIKHQKETHSESVTDS